MGSKANRSHRGLQCRPALPSQGLIRVQRHPGPLQGPYLRRNPAVAGCRRDRTPGEPRVFPQARHRHQPGGCAAAHRARYRHTDLRAVRRSGPGHRRQGRAPGAWRGGPVRGPGSQHRPLPPVRGGAQGLRLRGGDSARRPHSRGYQVHRHRQSPFRRQRHARRPHQALWLHGIGAPGGAGGRHRGPGVLRRDLAGEQPGGSGGDHAHQLTFDRQSGGPQAEAGAAAASPRCLCRGRPAMSALIRRLDARDPDFLSTLDALLAFESATDERIESAVAEILQAVRTVGDAAVLDYTRRFDHVDAPSMAVLELPRSELEAALASLSVEQREALRQAADRVRIYHERQRIASWTYTEADGTILGQQVTALDRVGLYVPGGRAAYPSSVLMNAIPAKVAGVGELIMVVPTPNGEQNPLVLAAAAITGVDRVFTIGGAQAVAALAYGTATIPQVDKIVGPGNAYVAAAKRRVFGTVGIDMVAGPSEVLVISDGSGHPDWVAMDLFAQAEHDELAQSILLCTDAGFIDRVAESIARLLPEMPRKDTDRKSTRLNSS